MCFTHIFYHFGRLTPVHWFEWNLMETKCISYIADPDQYSSIASAHAGQSSRLRQTAALDHATCIYLLSLLLSSPVVPFPTFSSSVKVKGEGRQIRRLPPELPITAWQCVQQCCLQNAAFVDVAQWKASCKPSFQLSFEMSQVLQVDGYQSAGCMEGRKNWGKSNLLFTFLYTQIKVKKLSVYDQRTFITSRKSEPALYQVNIALWGCIAATHRRRCVTVFCRRVKRIIHKL